MRRRPAPRAGEISPAPENSSTRVAGCGGAQPLAHLGAGLLADEQVDERDVRPVATGELERLRARVGAHAALHPRLLGEHQPKAPVHDVVVVDDEHAQPLGRSARPQPPAASSASGIGTTRRTCQTVSPAPALAELDHATDAERLERRQPQPHPGARPSVHLPVDPVVDDLHPERPVAVVRSAPTPGSGSRAWRRCAPPRRAPTGRAARAPTARPRLRRRRARSPRSAWTCRQPRAPRRAASCRVARGARPSGRCSALRRSPSAAWVSAAQRSRAAAGRSPSPSSAIETPNRRWITSSWISRARSIRCSSG